jgi:hypothetical protein
MTSLSKKKVKPRKNGKKEEGYMQRKGMCDTNTFMDGQRQSGVTQHAG